MSSSEPHLPFSPLQLYTTSSYPCSYLADQEARSQVVTPAHLINATVYSELVRQGFRRSGLFTYRPWCDNCSACVPVRLPVDRLQMTRSQQRTIKKHASLQIEERPLIYNQEHYDLYTRYQAQRHPGGGMDEDNLEQYAQFLLESSVDTHLIQFSQEDQLRMISIIDILEDGLSSVYTFFEPGLPGSGLGIYNILWQAQLCQQLNLPYLYLGYWIKECQKMSYKSNFQPIQGYIKGVWRELSPQETLF